MLEQSEAKVTCKEQIRVSMAPTITHHDLSIYQSPLCLHPPSALACRTSRAQARTPREKDSLTAVTGYPVGILSVRDLLLSVAAEEMYFGSE